MLKWIAACGLGLVLSCGTHAADVPAPNADEKAKIEASIKALDSDDFQARESAEKELVAMGAKALPSVKTALESTKEPESKVRLERVAAVLALSGESDPEKLAKLGKQALDAGDFEKAREYYKRAQELFLAQVGETSDANTKKALEAKVAKAQGRVQECEQYAQLKKNGNGNVRIMRAQGGAQVQMRVIAVGGNGGQVVVQTDEKTEGKESEKSDW
jgi:tetratricopeptide (TPR) repeat protein